MNEEPFTAGGTYTAEANRGAPGYGEPGWKEKAHETGDSFHDEAQRLKEAAREQGKVAADQIRAGVQSASQQAQQAGRTFIRTQQDSLAQRCSAYAEAARAASQKLGEGDGNMLAAPAQRAADGLEQLSGYLKNKDPMDLLGDVEAFARRRPEIVFGGLFVAGLAAARFLKASRRHLDERERTGGYVPVSGEGPSPISTSPSGGIGATSTFSNPGPGSFEGTPIGSSSVSSSGSRPDSAPSTSAPPWSSSTPASGITSNPATTPGAASSEDCGCGPATSGDKPL
jgi:hypothetical protein